ncbi:MAG TPA: branched-chain amino acid ABC transporter permease, partial [Anaerolineae bacterium]
MPRQTLVKSGLAFTLVLLLIGLPFASSSFVVTILSEVLIFSIFAMSLDLLIGYTGLVSFGHAAFFGIGAYATGYLTQTLSPNLLIILPLALLLTAAAALV